MSRFATLLLLFSMGPGASAIYASGNWVETGHLATGREGHTATLLPSAQVLVAGGRDHWEDLSSAELYDPATGSWTATGSLASRRSGHSATLLASGKVLAAGGAGNTCELYDPATGTWQATGALTHARSNHTATLLPSGKVLVAGGSESARLRSAELYDPTTGSWTATGSLASARSHHTATLLASGKVLVAGGEGASSSAELYYPATGNWSVTGPLASLRSSHTATLLPSGQVLAAGGVSPLSPATAELYDETTELWTHTGSFDSRSSHTATLLPSGRVLIASGELSDAGDLYDPATGSWTTTVRLHHSRAGHTATLLPSGALLVAGGKHFGTFFSSAELYEPDAGLWSSTAPIENPRHLHSATLLPSGAVLVVGGRTGGGARSSTELWNPSNRTWTSRANLGTPRYAQTATLLPTGQVLVAGGKSHQAALASAEVYEPADGSWTTTGSLIKARVDHTATLLPSGRVLVVGGIRSAALSSGELYDSDAGSWQAISSLRDARSGHTATLLHSGKVLIVGGFGDNGFLSTAELYDPATDTWSGTASLANPRTWHTATLLPSGAVLVTGGAASASLRSAELYDPESGTWTATAPLAEPRFGHSGSLLRSGKVLVAGGAGASALSSAELYDPATDIWTATAPLADARHLHAAVVLPSGNVMIAGGGYGGSYPSSVELYQPASGASERRPMIGSVSRALRFGTPVKLSGTRLRSALETGGGDTQSSATNYPLVQILSIEGGQLAWLPPDPRASFGDDPMRLKISNLPSILNPGWHLLTVFTAGVPSLSKPVLVICDLAITSHPQSRTAAIGSTVTLDVQTQGGRTFQWQKDGVDIPGATGPTYTTPPITKDDSGSVYRVKVDSGCTREISNEATLTVEDGESPKVELRSPNGGEYWLLSVPGGPANTELIDWTMSDNVRICQVEVSLWSSNDGSDDYALVPAFGGLPATFGPGGTCLAPGEATTRLEVVVPEEPPSSAPGANYKVEVRVTDHAGRSTIVDSRNPFFIVQPNLDAVKTLILSNTGRMQARMGTSADQAAALTQSLRLLANHPRVQGKVVDLAVVSGLSDLYAAWDGDLSDSHRANQVLFGDGGLHDHLLDLIEVYPGVEYVIVVGDDRIIPLARIQDRTTLLPESSYPSNDSGQPGTDLTADRTTVGQALAANQYLSDDPLAVKDPVRPEDLSASLFIPDLAVGRLVETPEEIITAIATFIEQGGILDLAAVDPAAGHKVLVTGYDFLLDSGRKIRQRWKNVLDLPSPHDDDSLAPVDGQLLSAGWDQGSIAGRRTALRSHLSGHGLERYSIVSLNGHATHYEEGVPGTDPYDIQGLSAADLYGSDACDSPSLGPVDLAGSVVYSVGCHGGLPVAGSCATDADHSLDLPQTLLSRGVQVYVANTGYGWGLKHGIGYAERLMEILTEELTAGGTVVMGKAVKNSKLRYFLENPRFDPYDEKSLMQWTFFGFPMYEVRIGIGAGEDGLSEPPAEKAGGRSQSEHVGAVRIERRNVSPVKAVPSFLILAGLHFDLSGAGVYTKYSASGNILADAPGCPEPDPGEPAGCYYTLHGLATGEADLPIQPYLVYDSHLGGTSQHGVLWMGGIYEQESGWEPVIGELVSNAGDSSDHGAAPRHHFLRPGGSRTDPGEDPDPCRPSDLVPNSLVVPAGEALKSHPEDPTYSIERRYLEIDLELLYYDNTRDSDGNCDRTGPELAPGPHQGHYHRVNGREVHWAVPASDEAGVWRVVVVTTDGSIEGDSRGAWVPLELADDGSGTWRGKLTVDDSSLVTYVIQAADRHGNVTWLDYVTSELPASGVSLGIPLPVEVEIGSDAPVLSLTAEPTQAGSPDDSVTVVTFEGDSETGAVSRFEDTAIRERPSFVQALLEKVDVEGLDGAAAVAASPDGRHVYVASSAADAVSVFSRQRATGRLIFEQVRRDGFAGVDGLGGAESVAVSPDGKHLYVASAGDDAVAVFERHQVTGRLAFVEVQLESAGADGLDGATSVTVSPDGRHVYVAGSLDDAVAVFGRHQTTGALTFVEARIDGVAGVAGLRGASSVAVSHDGHHVVVAATLDGAVAVFARDQATGNLTFVQALLDGVDGVDGIGGAASVTISPDDRQVYVASRFDQALTVFARDQAGRDQASGTLTFRQAFFEGIGGVEGLRGANSVTVSPDGHHVYATGSTDGALAIFVRDRATGALTFVDSLFEGTGGVLGLRASRSVTVSPDCHHVYVASGDLSSGGAVAVFERTWEAFSCNDPSHPRSLH